MRFRTLFVFIVLALTGLFALLNWEAFNAPTSLSLGFRTVEAPLGLVMLAVCFVIGAMCLAVVIYVQGAALFDMRRLSRELTEQRELADKAEASRFTELRTFMMGELQALTQTSADLRLGVLTRLDQIEQRMNKALQDTTDALSASIESGDRIRSGMPPNGSVDARTNRAVPR